jgi:hypothetical protein
VHYSPLGLFILLAWADFSWVSGDSSVNFCLDVPPCAKTIRTGIQVLVFLLGKLQIRILRDSAEPLDVDVRHGKSYIPIT